MANKLVQDLTAAAAWLTTDLLEKQPVGGPPSEKGATSQLITLLNTIYAPITGGLYVLKTGDTMTGPLLFSADNTIDVGASGATRPRTGYFGTSVVTDLLASPAATALSFASAGTTRANFNTSGHLLFNTDGANDIGATTATRPRAGYFVSVVEASGGFWARLTGTGSYAAYTCVSGDGIGRLLDSSAANFNRLQWGGGTSSFPSIKRSAATLQARLADDSAFTTVQATIQLAVNATAAAPPVTTHTIPFTDAAGQVYRVPCLV